MAASMFSCYLADYEWTAPWRVESAGTWTQSGLGVDRRCLALAQGLEIDLSAHKTVSIVELDVSIYDWIAVMERGHQEALLLESPALKGKVHLMTSLAGFPPSDIPDPLTMDTETARSILLDMRDCARLIAKRIATGGLVA